MTTRNSVTKLKWFGLIFYNAQFVPVAVGNLSHNFITQTADPVVPALVYQAIPVLTLGVASVVFAVRNQLDGLVETVVYSGASVAVGYAVLAVVGAFVFSLHSLGVTAHPDPTKAAVLGAAYPVVLATVVTSAVAFVRQ